MRGAGAMVFWHDVSDGEADDYHAWHSREHLAERVGIPGFRRGRRYEADAGPPHYFIMYEVDDLAVLSSKPYLDRLNDPTPWSQRALRSFRNSSRTLCRVRQSLGAGVGGWMLTVRFSAGSEDARIAAALNDWAAAPGIVGVHWLSGDPESSRVETAEKRLRDRPDEIADQVLLVEAYAIGALRRLRGTALGDAVLLRLGAAPGLRADLYRLLHCMGEEDLGRG